MIFKTTRYMKYLLLILFFSGPMLCAQELIRIPLSDGEIIEGRLNIPAGSQVKKIVIDVPGSGPCTYQNRRKVGSSTVFSFHDYFMNEFAGRGIAYFSYNTRYTVPDTIPPYYDRVDREKFCTCTPSQKVEDLEEIIDFLRRDSRLEAYSFILLGWSEGTIIASMVAERRRVAVDAIFLAGTPADDVYSIILWQHSGKSSMINMCRFFDINRDGIIQKDEYVNGDPRARARVGNLQFTRLDINNDTVLTADDYRLMLKPRLDDILSAIERNDDAWIWNSFFRVGSEWIIDHRRLEPNRTRLLKLELPVYIFHGEEDANCPVSGILEIQEEAIRHKKSNLHFYIFPGNDHSLEFLSWVINDIIPPGIEKLIEQVEKL